MIVKLMTEHHLEFLSLKEGCTGSSVSTLVKIPHCWKSHDTVHFSQLQVVVIIILLEIRRHIKLVSHNYVNIITICNKAIKHPISSIRDLSSK